MKDTQNYVTAQDTEGDQTAICSFQQNTEYGEGWKDKGYY